MFSIKNRKIVKWLVLVLISLFILYFIVPYKIILSPRLSELAFTYDSEDSVDIKEQVSYTLGSRVAKTAIVEKETGDTVLFVNKLILFNWLKKCKKNCSYVDSNGIEVGKSYIKIKCSKEEVPRKMIDADEFIRYYVVERLFYGIETRKIILNVEFIEQTTGNVLISAEWPKEEYNIDREHFFNEN